VYAHIIFVTKLCIHTVELTNAAACMDLHHARLLLADLLDEKGSGIHPAMITIPHASWITCMSINYIDTKIHQYLQ